MGGVPVPPYRGFSLDQVSFQPLPSGRAARAQAQYPIAAVLSCADSRVSPELAFDQGPGELFVVRLAGNFVNDDGLASLEYGVHFLGVPLVVILGHSDCGALAAAIKVLQEKTALPGHLPELVNSIKPAVEAAQQKSPSDLLAEATAENVRRNVRRLAGAEPVLGALLRNSKIKVVGGVYEISTGKVNLLQPCEKRLDPTCDCTSSPSKRSYRNAERRMPSPRPSAGRAGGSRTCRRRMAVVMTTSDFSISDGSGPPVRPGSDRIYRSSAGRLALSRRALSTAAPRPCSSNSLD